MASILNIDGVAFPAPTKYRVLLSDLDSSGSTRNESGELVRDRIRQGVTKIEAEFIVRGQLVAGMLAALSPAELAVTYYDPRQNTVRSSRMYVSDRSCDMKRCLESDTIDTILWSVSFNLIEY